MSSILSTKTILIAGFVIAAVVIAFSTGIFQSDSMKTGKAIAKNRRHAYPMILDNLVADSFYSPF